MSTNQEAATPASNLTHHLLTIRDAFRHHQNELRKKYKISANEMEIILFIDSKGPQRMKNIGERFGIKFSTLTSLVDKIENAGLVKRVNSKDDRRSILVTLTKKGNRMLDEYNNQVSELAEDILNAANGNGQAIVSTLGQVSPKLTTEPEMS